MVREFLLGLMRGEQGTAEARVAATTSTRAQVDDPARRAREILADRKKKEAYFKVFLPSAVKRYLGIFVRWTTKGSFSRSAGEGLPV